MAVRLSRRIFTGFRCREKNFEPLKRIRLELAPVFTGVSFEPNLC